MRIITATLTKKIILILALFILTACGVTLEALKQSPTQYENFNIGINWETATRLLTKDRVTNRVAYDCKLWAVDKETECHAANLHGYFSYMTIKSTGDNTSNVEMFLYNNYFIGLIPFEKAKAELMKYRIDPPEITAPDEPFGSEMNINRVPN